MLRSVTQCEKLCFSILSDTSLLIYGFHVNHVLLTFKVPLLIFILALILAVHVSHSYQASVLTLGHCWRNSEFPCNIRIICRHSYFSLDVKRLYSPNFSMCVKREFMKLTN
jgi:hypothetical protein